MSLDKKGIAGAGTERKGERVGVEARGEGRAGVETAEEPWLPAMQCGLVDFGKR